MNVVAIIIVYNKYYEDSITYKNLSNQNVEIVIFDNSSEEIRNKNLKTAIENDVKYFTLKKNVGLAVAYNHTIKNIECDFLFTFDDDTSLPDNYVEKMCSEIEEDYLVYVPYINSKKPSKKRTKKFSPFIKLLKSTRHYEYYYSINSGVLYNKKLFNKIQFNENLFVENIDFDMFDKLAEAHLIQKLVSVNLEQNFSTFSERCNQQTGRLKYTYNDYFVYYGKYTKLILLPEYCIQSIMNRDKNILYSYYKYILRRKRENVKHSNTNL